LISASQQTIDRIERLLSLNCPSPEEHLNELSGLLADQGETERHAQLRLLAVDIDDLVAQSRWHLGQTLLLFEVAPQALESLPLDDPLEASIRDSGVPTAALLLLRSYVRDADKVLYSDLEESRRGGTVGGWIFHMMIDSAIFRIIGAMDRMALLLWIVAALPMTDESGRQERVYFRSRKLGRIRDAVPCEELEQLVQIASGPLWEYALSYRDGLSHSAKQYSIIAGSLPAHEWFGPDGQRHDVVSDKWDADNLFALGRATYDQLLQALPLTVSFCRKQLQDERS